MSKACCFFPSGLASRKFSLELSTFIYCSKGKIGIFSLPCSAACPPWRSLYSAFALSNSSQATQMSWTRGMKFQGWSPAFQPVPYHWQFHASVLVGITLIFSQHFGGVLPGLTIVACCVFKTLPYKGRNHRRNNIQSLMMWKKLMGPFHHLLGEVSQIWFYWLLPLSAASVGRPRIRWALWAKVPFQSKAAPE